MRHLPSFFVFEFVICNPFLYSPFLKNSDPCSVLASLVFFCPINDHFKVSFYLKATLYDCKNDSKYRNVAPLRPKKQVRITNAELETRKVSTTFYLVCKVNGQKILFQFPFEAFLSQEVSSYRHIDLRNELLTNSVNSLSRLSNFIY